MRSTRRHWHHMRVSCKPTWRRGSLNRCVCVSVCVCVYMCVCVCVCVQAHLEEREFKQVCMRNRVHVRVRVCGQECSYDCACASACMCVFWRVWLCLAPCEGLVRVYQGILGRAGRTRTRMHTQHAHTHTHTHTHRHIYVTTGSITRTRAHTHTVHSQHTCLGADVRQRSTAIDASKRENAYAGRPSIILQCGGKPAQITRKP
jgi:hypothetical protein